MRGSRLYSRRRSRLSVHRPHRKVWGVIALFIAGGVLLLWLSVEVKDVVIVGVDEEIKGTIMNIMDIEAGVKMCKIDVKNLKESIMKKLPWVGDVKVKFSPMGEVRVRIVPRKPVMVWGGELMDSSGFCWKGKPPLGLPVVRGKNGAEERLLVGSFLLNAGWEWDSVYVSKSGIESFIGKTRVLWGNGGFGVKAERLLRMEEEGIRWRNCVEIDLRYRKQIVLRRNQ